MHSTLDLNKEHLQEHEYLRADFELLRQEVDSISQAMKLQEQWLRTMGTTLKRLQENNLV